MLTSSINLTQEGSGLNLQLHLELHATGMADRCFACESDPSECTIPAVYCNPRPQCIFYKRRVENSFSVRNILCCKCQNKLFDSATFHDEIVWCSSANEECGWFGRLRDLDKHRSNDHCQQACSNQPAVPHVSLPAGPPAPVPLRSLISIPVSRRNVIILGKNYHFVYFNFMLFYCHSLL